MTSVVDSVISVTTRPPLVARGRRLSDSSNFSPTGQPSIRPDTIKHKSEAGDSMKLDHICLAVRRIDSAAKVLTTLLGYRPRTDKVENTRQQVVVQFFSREGELDIKVIEPSNRDSPLVDFLKRKGEGLHHLGYRVENVEEGLAGLEEKGARVTARPEPGEAFDDHLIAFAYLGAGLNIELIDTDERRATLDDA